MTVTELEILEALDFDHEPPCEHSCHETDHRHTGPAALVIDAGCRTCGFRARLLMCRAGYVSAVWIHCLECGATCDRADYWTVVGEV